MRPIALQPAAPVPCPKDLPGVADDDAVTPYVGIGFYTYHKYQKALHSPVPLDAHGNPLPQEEAEEILQTAMRPEFPPEEGFIDGDAEQYTSPSEDGGHEGERRDEERDGVKLHIEGEVGLLPPCARQYTNAPMGQ